MIIQQHIQVLLKDYVTIAMVIILVAMAMPISSNVKDKNSIFTASDEDIFFSEKKKGVYVIKKNYIRLRFYASNMDRSQVKIKHIWLITLSVETGDRQPELHVSCLH